MKKEHHNLFLIGPMGAGKTSVGRYLARLLNKTFYDSDLEIEKKTGVSLTWIYDLEGIDRYRVREAQMIEELSAMENIVLSTGGGCVETKDVRKNLKERGLVIYMEVTLQTQLDRLKHDKRRPLLQGENPQEVLIRLWEEREPIYEDMADLIVVTDNRSVRDVCEDILLWFSSDKK
jgi:shikimate kinase